MTARHLLSRGGAEARLDVAEAVSEVARDHTALVERCAVRQEQNRYLAHWINTSELGTVQTTVVGRSLHLNLIFESLQVDLEADA